MSGVTGDELAARIAVVRTAKQVKYVRRGDEKLEAAELALIFAAAGDVREVLLDYWGDPAWLPCARCGRADGTNRKGCHIPQRIRGERFGVAGKICKRCYDFLFQKQQRGAHAMSHHDDARCLACAMPWESHSPECSRHPYRPGFVPDAAAEAAQLDVDKARTRREAARRRVGSFPRVEAPSASPSSEVGSKGALAGYQIERSGYVRHEAAEGLGMLDVALARINEEPA